MNIKQENLKNKTEKKFLDSYTEKYKEDLGIHIKEYSISELTQLSEYEEVDANKEKEMSKIKLLWEKIMKLLKLKK